MPGQHSKAEITFFVSILLAVLVLSFFVFRPFLTTLAVAAVLAVLTYPLYRWIWRWVKFAGLAAFLTTILVCIAVAGPLLLIGGMLFDEARSISRTLTTNGVENPTSAIYYAEGYIKQYLPELTINVSEVINQTVSWLTRNLGNAFSVTAQLLLSLVVGLIAYFFFLKDGRSFVNALVHLSPLGDRHDRAILQKLSNTIHSVIQGSLLIALIQGILTSVGFFIFGVPSPVLWGSMAAIGALIPGVGTAVVILPAIIFLFATGQTGAAIGLLIWGATAVGLIDNLLLPKLVGQRARIHSLFILISVLGGLALFGPSGFLLGPLVISLVYGMADIYLILFKDDIDLAGRETEAV